MYYYYTAVVVLPRNLAHSPFAADGKSISPRVVEVRAQAPRREARRRIRGAGEADRDLAPEVRIGHIVPPECLVCRRADRHDRDGQAHAKEVTDGVLVLVM